MLEEYGESRKTFEVRGQEGFGIYEISPWATALKISKTAQFIKKYPDFGSELIAVCDDNIERASLIAENQYLGCYKSFDDFIDSRPLTDPQKYILLFNNYSNYRELEKTLCKKKKLRIIRTKLNEMHIFRVD